MKNPLHYQLSEYDCGPTSLLNAMSYLFEREELPPEIIRNVMLYSLDCHGAEGTPGKSGTSCTAMMFLCNWLDNFGRVGQLPVSGRYLSGKSVYIGGDSLINDALRRGGAAVVRLYAGGAHYVLMTGAEDGRILLFDPYYEQSVPEPDISVTREHPFSHNRVVPFARFNQTTQETYALGPEDEREAVLLFNERTMLTADDTIEYFI